MFTLEDSDNNANLREGKNESEHANITEVDWIDWWGNTDEMRSCPLQLLMPYIPQKVGL